MVIICHTEPGYSNQLFQNAFALAYARENKRLFYNTTNGEWRKYYKMRTPVLQPLVAFVSRYRFKTPSFLSRLLKIGNVNLDSLDTMSQKISDLSKYRIAFISGWFLRMPLSKHRAYLKRAFSLRSKYIRHNALVNTVIECNHKGYILVGVHARRGDYETYEGGKYFYSWDFYLQKIKEMESMLGGNNKVKFILFSNEKAPSTFKSKNLIISSEPWYIDHHLMSQCDYLMGPPSTFTIWAGFLGEGRFCQIDNVNQKLSLSDFYKIENPLCY